MRRRSQLPRFALTIGLFIVIGTRMPGQKQKGNLEFRLKPESIQAGLPRAFSFLLVNTTNHDVRVPMPTVECENSFSGAIWLRLSFKPLTKEPTTEGGGCALDNERWPPILDRIKEWQLLHSGETLTLTADQEQLFYDSKPGSYEFWAVYAPPSIDPSDQKKLLESGIDFPRERLTTKYLMFSRAQ